ncbi:MULTISPECIES: hypothetical protein [Fischerella]|uniref:hypothetical protein n=1 Tax=Fischerella TaxID=1190 RepID=UPI00030B541B|nr:MULTISPECIES: hypothetical protein [Fischerella]MBD2433131.1 hypothetical protein [Fischerella sp. FACHB-380]
MSKQNYLELFYIHLERLIYILKIKDKKLVEYWLEEINTNIDIEYADSLLIAAIFELSVGDIQTFHWTLDNFSDLQPYINLLDSVTRFAIQKLIKKGFIPGQDFSNNSQRQLLLNENAKTVLMADTSKSDKLLLEKVLLIHQQIHSLTL